MISPEIISEEIKIVMLINLIKLLTMHLNRLLCVGF